MNFNVCDNGGVMAGLDPANHRQPTWRSLKNMNLRYYLKKAQKEGWAVGQFNFSTPEQLRGILAAAKKLKSPVILGTSRGESEYLGIK